MLYVIVESECCGSFGHCECNSVVLVSESIMSCVASADGRRSKDSN